MSKESQLKKSNRSKAAKANANISLGSKGRIVGNYEELEELVHALRTIGARIVLTQGTFDFIHIGHFLYLEKAKEYGDVLIVGVDSDDKVRERKGPDRPIVSEDERVAMLSHVSHVDLVIIKPDKAPKWSLTKIVRPDTLIATQETYTAKQLEALKEYCGEVIALEPQAVTSTTAKLRRMNMNLSKKMKDAVTQSINQTFEKLLKDA